jgi:uncharacterized peroxidase-related enzyme
MNRISQLDPATSTGKTKQLFDAVQQKLGLVPNMVRVMGHAPAALEAYLGFSGALAQGTFDARLREQIALTVGESNMCSYCLSAHTFIGSKLGLAEADIENARNAAAALPKSDAVLKLARTMVVQRGELSDSDIAQARAAGLGDADIVETVANVALNIFTNYINHVARTVVDFPAVKAVPTQAA